MKSRAHIKGHPIHPILVCFPIAFFIGTFLFDLLGVVMDRLDFSRLGYYLCLAGMISTLAAAVPGVIDYTYTIPANSSAKKRGAKHGLLNVTVLLIFTAAWFYRRGDDPSATVILLLEAVGVVGLFVSGWLGGTLVYRNQIGVDPRYANAGKWSELALQQEQGEVEVAEANELKVNQMKLLRLKNKRIVLGRTEEGYVAFDDRCPHRGGSLAGGAMICGTVQCPWHGSQFSVTTGAVKAGPAKTGISTYRVHESAGKVWLTL